MSDAESRQGPQQSITTEHLGLEAAMLVLPELQDLLDGAYHDSHMYRDLTDDIKSQPDPFQLFLARSGNTDRMPLGVAVVEAKVHEAFDYLGFPPVHVKRFTVSSEARGTGIGKSLLDQSKNYVFKELALAALFGESNEIGALSMYGREGALYSRDAIQEYWRRNTPEQALVYFAADISDPTRRGERYPHGQGIRFVFARDDETEQFFRDQGYISKDELLSTKPN